MEVLFEWEVRDLLEEKKIENHREQKPAQFAFAKNKTNNDFCCRDIPCWSDGAIWNTTKALLKLRMGGSRDPG